MPTTSTPASAAAVTPAAATTTMEHDDDADDEEATPAAVAVATVACLSAELAAERATCADLRERLYAAEAREATLAAALAAAPTIVAHDTLDIDDVSPLFGPSLEDLPAGVLERVLLPLLDPIDRTMLAKVGRGCRAAVVASGLPRALGRVRLRLRDFVGSVERLSWARENGCRWDEWTSSLIAEGGNLEVLKWAREHQCLWDTWTCACAARGRGHLVVLRCGSNTARVCKRCYRRAPG